MSEQSKQMTWDEVVAEMVKRGDRIRELEAAFNLADEKWSTVSTKLEKAEAALARVKELPERWRKSVIIIPTQINAKDCADELEAALAEPITCSKPESICKADDNKEPEHE